MDHGVVPAPRSRKLLRAVMAGIAFALTVGAPPSLVVAQAPPGESSAELPRRSQFGVRVAAVPDEIRSRLKLDTGEGVLVQVVVPGTSAESAGIQPGDILVALEGRKITGVADFLKRAPALSVGRTAGVVLVRGGRRAVAARQGTAPRSW